MTHPARHLSGYGAFRPDLSWPDGSKVAVNLCVNYEEGGELCVLNGDDRSESRIADVAVTARVGGRDLNIEQSYEYGSRVGYWRLIDSIASRGFRATVNLVGLAGELVPEPLQAMIAEGWDLQPHGWRWIDFDTLTEAEEREMIAKSTAQVKALTGRPPLGYYAGMPSLNTRRLAIEAGYRYDSDCYNDDLPYWTRDFGAPHLCVPYSLDTNDSKFARREGYDLAGQFAEYLRDTLDTLLEEGRWSMMTVGLHARLTGRPGRIRALNAFLDYLKDKPVWVCRRDDLAMHFMEVCPAEG